MLSYGLKRLQSVEAQVLKMAEGLQVLDKATESEDKIE